MPRVLPANLFRSSPPRRPNKPYPFYRDILELTLVEDSPFAMVFSDAGQMLRIQKIADHSPADHTVHGWQVGDIEDEVAKLALKGVSFLRYDGLDQTPAGIWTTPDGHKVAWFEDPGGNRLSVAQLAG